MVKLIWQLTVLFFVKNFQKGRFSLAFHFSDWPVVDFWFALLGLASRSVYSEDLVNTPSFNFILSTEMTLRHDFNVSIALVVSFV